MPVRLTNADRFRYARIGTQWRRILQVFDQSVCRNGGGPCRNAYLGRTGNGVHWCEDEADIEEVMDERPDV